MEFEIVHNDKNAEHEKNTYRPRPQLPEPLVVMRSLEFLIKHLESGFIDIDPEYQREVCWTADRMTGLINSLMENFYIPPIILNKKSLSNSTNNTLQDIRVCIDGKQRLSSVRAFVKGLIPCHDQNREKWWFCDVTSTGRRRILSSDMQKTFLAKKFVSFEFTDLSLEQEEDLFARVQLGVQLSAGEKIRATTGPWQELARLFVDDFPNIYSLMRNRARAKDFRLTLSCFSQIIEVMHPSAPNGTPVFKTNNNEIPKFLSNKGTINDGIKSHLTSTWTTFEHLIERDSVTFTNVNGYLHRVLTFAPVEMIGVTVLISMYSGRRNSDVLLGDVRSMRKALRAHFADLRTHTSVWKFVWEFLKSLRALNDAVMESISVSRLEQSADSAAGASTSSPRLLTLISETRSTSAGQLSAESRPPNTLPCRRSLYVREEGSVESSLNMRPPKRRRMSLDRGRSRTPTIENQIKIDAISLSSGPRSTAFIPRGVGDAPGELQAVAIETCEDATHTAKNSSAPTRSHTKAASSQSCPLPHKAPVSSTCIGTDGQGSFTDGNCRSFSDIRTPTWLSAKDALAGDHIQNGTQQQWTADIEQTAQSRFATSNASSLKRQLLRKPGEPFSHTVVHQPDCVIDLTCDTENEQQNLPSKSKARTPAARKRTPISASEAPPGLLQASVEPRK